MAPRADRPTTRLLFDENLPWRVAAALRILEFPVSHIGDDSASPPSPDRGSSDQAVLSHAESANQLIVTSNLDMILLLESLTSEARSGWQRVVRGAHALQGRTVESDGPQRYATATEYAYWTVRDRRVAVYQRLHRASR